MRAKINGSGNFMDTLTQDNSLPDIIRDRLPNSLFSDHIYYFPVITSTNTYACDLAKQGKIDQGLIIADNQTRGHGKMGRKWFSPSNANLLFSVILRPPFSVDRIFSLTMITALAIVDAIRKITGLRTLIKWPNDIYYNEKK